MSGLCGTGAALSAPETCTELCTDLSELRGPQRRKRSRNVRFRTALDLTWRNFKPARSGSPRLGRFDSYAAPLLAI